MFIYTVRLVRIVHAVMATVVAVPIMLVTTEFLKDRYLVGASFPSFSKSVGRNLQKENK
jgi:hypothetical protein